MSIFLLIIGISIIVLGCIYYMQYKHDREIIDKVIDFLENCDHIIIGSYFYGYTAEGWYKDRRYDIRWNKKGMDIRVSYKYDDDFKKTPKPPQNKYEVVISSRKSFDKVCNLMSLYRDRKNYMGDDIIQDDVEIEKLRYTNDNAKEQLIKDIIKELK